jgi:hypothetical protein
MTCVWGMFKFNGLQISLVRNEWLTVLQQCVRINMFGKQMQSA